MADQASGHQPETISTREGPELGRLERSGVISRPVPSEYPLIDNDPHFNRVIRYARPSDWIAWAASAAAFPASLLWMERLAPTGVSRKSFASVMRFSTAMGVTGGFLLFYCRSINRFYGWSENRREIEMDMREMVDKVKKGEPLYGKSDLTMYMQSAASRQSRYSAAMMHVIPWFNFVNHPHHGVDTAKYYQQAETELEAEKAGKR